MAMRGAHQDGGSDSAQGSALAELRLVQVQLHPPWQCSTCDQLYIK